MLYGNISDKNTGESLIGASLSVVDLNQGTVTDDKGEYSLSLPKGKHTIIQDRYVKHQYLTRHPPQYSSVSNIYHT